jgi:hypothetical protein
MLVHDAPLRFRERRSGIGLQFNIGKYLARLLAGLRDLEPFTKSSKRKIAVLAGYPLAQDKRLCAADAYPHPKARNCRVQVLGLA